jgi:hypothetical protein
VAFFILKKAFADVLHTAPVGLSKLHIVLGRMGEVRQLVFSVCIRSPAAHLSHVGCIESHHLVVELFFSSIRLDISEPGTSK